MIESGRDRGIPFPESVEDGTGPPPFGGSGAGSVSSQTRHRATMVEPSTGEEDSLIDPDIAALVADIRSQYPGCFACGPDNPVGLHIDPAEMDGSEAVATYRPIEHHGGAGDTLHGGLAATVLDEIMVWAGILTERVLSVTGTMDLRFVRPVSTADEITLRGRVDERSGRRLRCSGELAVDGRTAVSAGGLYLVVRSFE